MKNVNKMICDTTSVIRERDVDDFADDHDGDSETDSEKVAKKPEPIWVHVCKKA